MLVAGDDGETGDAVFAHCAEDLVVLAVETAVDETVTLARPLASQLRRQVLHVRAPGERAERMTPDLPGRLAGAQLVDEPGTLLPAEVRLARGVDLRVRDVLVAEAQRRRRLAAVVGAAVIEDARGIVVGEQRELVRRERAEVDVRGL